LEDNPRSSSAELLRKIRLSWYYSFLQLCHLPVGHIPRINDYSLDGTDYSGLETDALYIDPPSVLMQTSIFFLDLFPPDGQHFFKNGFI